MRDILLAIESVIILIFCITWCFCLQSNFDNLRDEYISMKKELFEFREDTSKEIRVLKTDIDLTKKINETTKKK